MSESRIQNPVTKTSIWLYWNDSVHSLDCDMSCTRGSECYLEKRGSRKILAGSQNLVSVFDKSRSLVFSLFVFTFFESRIFFTNESRDRISNKDLGVSASLGFYHSPPLVVSFAYWSTNKFWAIYSIEVVRFLLPFCPMQSYLKDISFPLVVEFHKLNICQRQVQVLFWWFIPIRKYIPMVMFWRLK